MSNRNALSQPRSAMKAARTTSEALDEENLKLSLSLSLSPPDVRPPNHHFQASNINHSNVAVPLQHSQAEGVVLRNINLDYSRLPPRPCAPLPLPLPLPLLPPVLPHQCPSQSQLPAARTKRAIADPSSSSNQPEKQTRSRRKYEAATGGSDSFVIPPFSWATNSRAHIYSLAQLLQRGIHAVTGEVQCKRCETRYEIEYPLQSKFEEIKNYIAKNKATMHDRAPAKWMNPALPPCQKCHQPNCAKPVISQKKRSINWLFLLLGGMLGCCTLDQLKYFCKHTNSHRTGAKDRVLYSTYLGLCKQLAGSDDECGLFDHH